MDISKIKQNLEQTLQHAKQEGLSNTAVVYDFMTIARLAMQIAQMTMMVTMLESSENTTKDINS